MNGFSASLMTKKMRYHYRPDWQKLKYLLIPSVEKDLDSQDLIFTACRNINGYTTLEKRSGLIS